MSDSDQEIVTLFFSASLIILLLVGLVIVFVLNYQRRVWRQKSTLQELETEHQRNLLASAHEAIEATRKRIAGNLHDDLGANISTAKLQLQELQSAQDDQVRHSAVQVNQILDESLKNLRRIVNDLLPPTLQQFGLKPALEELCQQAHQSNLQVSLEWLGPEMERNPTIDLPVFRIAQELLNNSLKHAEASEIRYTVSVEEGHIHLGYEDNGRGFDSSLIKRNVGLENMQSRASLLSGNVAFRTAPHHGFKARLDIPLQTPALS